MMQVILRMSSLCSTDIQNNISYLVDACIDAEILSLWNNIFKKIIKSVNI